MLQARCTLTEDQEVEKDEQESGVGWWEECQPKETTGRVDDNLAGTDVQKRSAKRYVVLYGPPKGCRDRNIGRFFCLQRWRNLLHCKEMDNFSSDAQDACGK